MSACVQALPMTVRETAKYLGISEQTVYQLCAARKLVHYRMGVRGGVIVVTEEAADAYRESCRVGPDVATKPKRPRKYVTQTF